MTTTTTFRPLLVQHGVGTFIAWTDYEVDIGSQVGVQSYAVSATKQYSQVYDFGLTFDSERGLPICWPRGAYASSPVIRTWMNRSLSTTMSSRSIWRHC